MDINEQFYTDNVSKWTTLSDRYVLIHNGELVGFYPSKEEASDWAYIHFGLNAQFLIAFVLTNAKREDVLNLLRSDVAYGTF